MNDQERQIISDIFKRLEQAAGQSRDADAERFINDKVRAQPYAPYAMAQALYVQEEAMKSLNQQLEQTKAENDQLRHQVQNPPQSGGFLSSIFGGGQRPQPAPPSQFGRPGPQPGYAPQGGPPPQQGGPWGGQQGGGYAPPPQQGGPWGGQPQAQAAPQGGGFLRGALTTAAGVAGGLVVGNALMNAFSGHGGGGHSTLGSLSQSDMASLGFPNGGGSSGGVQDASFGDGGGVFGDGGGSNEPQYQDASFSDGGNSWGGGDGGQDSGYQDASFDDGGSDFGGGGGGGGDDSWT